MGKNKAFEHLSRHKFFYLLILILGVGIFLRTWNFSDWMHFELDQARDAKVVDLAVEHGIGNLPLLGPKAAGSFLRLGPAFYYFEYLGAKLFGATPAGMASSNLIFSILSLPLFYFFARRYFDRKISAVLLFLFSSSIFLVMYSRFAWNPNSLPFFTLLAFYALLRAADVSERNKGWWFVASAGALAVVTQLHFVALMVISAVMFAFLLIRRPRIDRKAWLAAAAMIIFFYIPPIINDIKTGGDNIKEFKEVFLEKSGSEGNGLLEKAVRDYTESARGYLLMVSGNQVAELPKFDLKNGTPDISCDAGCRKNSGWGAAALVFFTAGILILGRRVFESWKEGWNTRKEFIVLSGLWFLISSIVFLPIAYDFAPRFFLVVAGLPFIFLGLILEILERAVGKKGYFWLTFSAIAIIFSVSSLYAVAERFSELSRAPHENFEIRTDVILKERDRTTLEQQYMIADHVENIQRENGYPIYINSEAFYRRALLYHLEKRDVLNDDFRNSQIAKKVYRNGNYFLIYPTSSNLQSRIEKYLDNYSIVGQKEFGTLVVIRLVPKEEAINATEQEFGPEKKARSASGVPVRCRWNEIFRECNPDEPEDSE